MREGRASLKRCCVQDTPSLPAQAVLHPPQMGSQPALLLGALFHSLRLVKALKSVSREGPEASLGMYQGEALQQPWPGSLLQN